MTKEKTVFRGHGDEGESPKSLGGKNLRGGRDSRGAVFRKSREERVSRKE